MAGNKTETAEKERVEPNTMKRRMVLLWRFLYYQTDENHPVSTYDTVDYMAEHGIKDSKKTIKSADLKRKITDLAMRLLLCFCLSIKNS